MGNINFNLSQCALCGCLFSPNIPVDNGIDNLRHDVSWKGKLMCIGLRENTGLKDSRCFISGSGYADGTVPGAIHVRKGDDPNFPFDIELNKINPDVWVFGTYKTYNHGVNNILPFHVACLEVFKQVVHYESGGGPEDLSQDALYKAMVDLALEAHQALSIDYMLPESEQFLAFRPAPLHAELKAYCDTLPQFNSESSTVLKILHTPNTQDPFVNLPGELILRVIELLPLSSAISFRLASRPVSSITLSNFTWRMIMFHDMPYLCDIFSQVNTDVDIREVYKAIKLGVRCPDFPLMKMLANRKRIWNVSLQIAHSYLEHLQD